MNDLYGDTKEDIVKTYRRIHANGEQTHVAIISVGEDDYAAISYDVDPRDYDPVAGKLIAFDPTLEGAVERADRWMETHPKGILGTQDEDGDGLWDSVMRALKKLNDYGNDMIEEQQQGASK